MMLEEKDSALQHCERIARDLQRKLGAASSGCVSANACTGMWIARNRIRLCTQQRTDSARPFVLPSKMLEQTCLGISVNKSSCANMQSSRTGK